MSDHLLKKMENIISTSMTEQRLYWRTMESHQLVAGIVVPMKIQSSSFPFDVMENVQEEWRT